jgi:hypothetical protein
MNIRCTLVRFKELVFDPKTGKKILVERREALGKNNAMKLILANGTPQAKYKTEKV